MIYLLQSLLTFQSFDVVDSQVLKHFNLEQHWTCVNCARVTLNPVSI